MLEKAKESLFPFREWADKLAALPPRPWVIRASHTVPYGRVYRQWDTRGRLIVWANRGEIADLPHRPWPTSTVIHNVIDHSALASIPVVYE